MKIRMRKISLSKIIKLIKPNLKSLWVKTFLVFALFIPTITLLSAFKFSDSVTISRLEFAALIQTIVLKALPDSINSAPENKFNDISAKELALTNIVTGYKMMDGFPDGSFRPDDSLRNHEILWYLNRSWEFLRVNAPESLEAQKLGKIIGLSRSRYYRNLRSSFSIFPETSEPGDIAQRNVLKKLRSIFGLESQEKSEVLVSLVDMVTGKPVENAFLAVDSAVFATNQDGQVSFSIDSECDAKYEILVSAEGYQTTSLKRDSLQKKKIRLKLKPLKAQFVIRAYSENDGKAIEKFLVRMNETAVRNSIAGVAVLKTRDSGYHLLKIEAAGFETLEKRVYSGKHTLELDVSLKKLRS